MGMRVGRERGPEGFENHKAGGGRVGTRVGFLRDDTERDA